MSKNILCIRGRKTAPFSVRMERGCLVFRSRKLPRFLRCGASLFFLVLILGSFLMKTPVFAAITGSAHDFSEESWAGNQVCGVCHTPHGSSGNSLAPFWNHATTATNPFTLFQSLTLTATMAQPAGASKACLSCHDGTVAIDSFGGSTGTHFVSGDALIGTDLSNDHPVSFTYDTALATSDGGLNDPSTKTIGAGGGGLSGKKISEGLLADGKLECSSCHDVHKNKGYSQSSAKLLLVDNAKSALCLTCHNK